MKYRPPAKVYSKVFLELSKGVYKIFSCLSFLAENVESLYCIGSLSK